MRYALLSPKCRIHYRAEYKENKCFTQKKALGKISKCKSLNEHVKNLSKVQERCMSGKSFTQLVISPLLTENEKKEVRFGKSLLGYSQNELSKKETVFDDCSDFSSDSSSDSSSSSDDEEYIFFEKHFIANNC